MRRLWGCVVLLVLSFAIPSLGRASHIHSTRAQQSLEELIGGSGRIEVLSVQGRAAPALSDAGRGRIYFDSGTNTFQASQNGGAYVTLVGAGGSAPANATYITQTAHAGLSAEQALSVLATGYVKVTTGTGVLTSQAVPVPVSDGGTGLTATTINQLLYSSAANTVAGLTSANNGVLITSGAGVPSISSTLPSGIAATNASLTTPTIVTSATGPLLIGGTGTTSTLTLRSTSGVGAAGADIIFQTGNNGAIEGGRWLNSGNLVIGSSGAAGTSAINNLVFGPSTAPSTSPADVAQCRGADIAGAGTFGLECRDEGGNLYKIGNGQILVPDGTLALPSFSFVNRTTSGIIYSVASTGPILVTQSTAFFGNDSNLASRASVLSLGFASAIPATDDLMVERDAANIHSWRNGTNAQEGRIENTYTSASNREYGKIGWTSNVFRVGTVKGSVGGTARAMALTTDDTERWTVGATSGHLVGAAGYALQTSCVAIGSLPAGSAGMRTCVNDQLTSCPVLDSTFTAGGGVTCSAFHNGTAWVHS